MSLEDRPLIPGYFVCRECACQFPRSQEAPQKRDCCRRCAQMMRKRNKREGQRQRLAESRLKELISAARGQKINAPHVSEICEGMINTFGGVESFCNEWKLQIDIAMENRPGSKMVLDHFYTLFKMVATSTENRDTAPDVAGLSDDELAAEMIAFLEDVEPKLFSPAEAKEDDEGVIDVDIA